MNWRAYTGVAVRSMVWAYLQAIAFVMFTLLVIALTIDLTDSLDNIRARAAETEQPVWRVLLPYLSFRSVDIVTRLLGMAALIGAGVTTALRHQRMEDVVLAAAGASPAVMLSALLMVGAVTGAIQGSFQNWLRPPTVERQVEMGLGQYGRWFGNTQLTHRWFVNENLAMRAEVRRGADASLTDVTIFEGIDQPVLSRIIFAESAAPLSEDEQWRLQGVTLWQGENGTATQRMETLDIWYPLNIDRVQYFGVHGYFMPNSALKQVARLTGTQAASDARTALAFRKLAFFLPGVFALLGASLALAGRRGRRLAPFRLLPLVTIGYVTLVSFKVFWALGIHGRLPPYWAALIPISLAVLLSVVLQLQQAGYLRRNR
ncbi:LptF/LptG family permease [Shimia sp.]|uniref:LptF/LptG family permease n=1 Tax=Shimia sp. TaxID=1954381 RepID=UPI00329A623B